METSETLIEVKNVCQEFHLTKGLLQSLRFEKGKLVKEDKVVHAVNDVSFEIKKGEVFSLVGESGCGKSTTARTVIRLLEPTSGQVLYKGKDISHLGPNELLPYRKSMQMIFQDPYASLNPRQRVADIIMEPLLFHGIAKTKEEARERCMSILARVGLRPEQAGRYPHQFSGGQRQRIGIARALAVNPEFIIADEPVSALDVSIQAQILNLLKSLQKELDLTCIFIGHGLGAVNYVSRRIAVMYLGKLVETGESSELFEHPVHPYTRTLLGAVPIPDPRKREENWGETSEGTAYEPSITGAEDKGCPFKDRCFRKRPECSSAEVPLRPVRPGSTHLAACSPAVLEVKRNE